MQRQPCRNRKYSDSDSEGEVVVTTATTAALTTTPLPLSNNVPKSTSHYAQMDTPDSPAPPTTANHDASAHQNMDGVIASKSSWDGGHDARSIDSGGECGMAGSPSFSRRGGRGRHQQSIVVDDKSVRVDRCRTSSSPVVRLHSLAPGTRQHGTHAHAGLRDKAVERLRHRRPVSDRHSPEARLGVHLGRHQSATGGELGYLSAWRDHTAAVDRRRPASCAHRHKHVDRVALDTGRIRGQVVDSERRGATVQRGHHRRAGHVGTDEHVGVAATAEDDSRNCAVTGLR